MKYFPIKKPDAITGLKTVYNVYCTR